MLFQVQLFYCDVLPFVSNFLVKKIRSLLHFYFRIFTDGKQSFHLCTTLTIIIIIDLILYKSCKCEMHSYVLDVFIFIILSMHGNRCFDAVKLCVVTTEI